MLQRFYGFCFSRVNKKCSIWIFVAKAMRNCDLFFNHTRPSCFDHLVKSNYFGRPLLCAQQAKSKQPREWGKSRMRDCFLFSRMWLRVCVSENGEQTVLIQLDSVAAAHNWTPCSRHWIDPRAEKKSHCEGINQSVRNRLYYISWIGKLQLGGKKIRVCGVNWQLRVGNQLKSRVQLIDEEAICVCSINGSALTRLHNSDGCRRWFGFDGFRVIYSLPRVKSAPEFYKPIMVVFYEVGKTLRN